MKRKDDTRLVYCCDQGRMCPVCQQPIARCCCKKQISDAAKDSVVRVGRETKGRKGKGVTVITGIPLAGAELKKYVQQLKKSCGSGGTIKQGAVEIQGDHRDQLIHTLQQQGWVVKRTGG